MVVVDIVVAVGRMTADKMAADRMAVDMKMSVVVADMTAAAVDIEMAVHREQADTGI